MAFSARTLLPLASMMLLLGGCTIIIQAPIVCPEGTELLNGRCMGRVVSSDGSTPAASANNSGQSQSANSGSVVSTLKGFPNGGSEQWDEQVKSLLLQNYDSNRSGSIDSREEIDAIPCDVFKAMDQATRNDDDVPVMALYGFASGYLWAGDVLGFSGAMREASASRMEGCGLGLDD